MITPADDPDDHPFGPYDAATRRRKSSGPSCRMPSWERRSLAHEEILRRGGSLLAEATRRLAAVKPDDPALFHLPWLAAASGSEEAAQLLTKLATRSARRSARAGGAGAGRVPASSRRRAELFEKALTDADPRVQLAGLIAFLSLPGEPPLDPVVKLAHGPDLYLRQTAALLLARKAKLEQIVELTHSPDPGAQLAGALAAGMRLTVLPSDFTPPQQVKLIVSRRRRLLQGEDSLRGRRSGPANAGPRRQLQHGGILESHRTGP